MRLAGRLKPLSSEAGYSSGKDLERKTCRGNNVVDNIYLYDVAEMGGKGVWGETDHLPESKRELENAKKYGYKIWLVDLQYKHT